MAKLLRHALQEYQDEKTFKTWMTWYPHMGENTETFEEFKKRVNANIPKASDKSLDEIEEEMDAIIMAYESEAK